MARDTQDREDLLAEATALVERAELVIEGESEPVVAGFRRDGCLSLFFGSDPVYQFNTQSALRRAYVAGKLYKAEKGSLVALERRREGDVLFLVRHELDDGETQEFLLALKARLCRLREALAGRNYTVAGQTPPDCNVVGRLLDWLTARAGSTAIAVSAHAR
jgi:hypothetical protein